MFSFRFERKQEERWYGDGSLKCAKRIELWREFLFFTFYPLQCTILVLIASNMNEETITLSAVFVRNSPRAIEVGCERNLIFTMLIGEWNCWSIRLAHDEGSSSSGNLNKKWIFSCRYTKKKKTLIEAIGSISENLRRNLISIRQRGRRKRFPKLSRGLRKCRTWRRWSEGLTRPGFDELFRPWIAYLSIHKIEF